VALVELRNLTHVIRGHHGLARGLTRRRTAFAIRLAQAAIVFRLHPDPD
jgi:hypothetical protein